MARITELRRHRVRRRAEAVERRVPGRRRVQRHELQPEDHRPVYKACWYHAHGRVTCSDAGVLAAMDDAAGDGVDVLSLSLGGMLESPGSLHLAARGVTVVFAAGNSGPVPGSVQNASPWVISVAASTVDRSFPTVISLGNGEKLVVCT